MDVRILGPFDVRANGGSIDLGGPRPRAFLAALVLHPREFVSSDRLVHLLWGESAPRSAHHLLHVYVSSLRKALDAAMSRSVLVTRAPGYVLELDPDDLDAHRFERRLGEGRRLLAAGNPEAAAGALREALGLWRGEALTDFAYEPFAQNEIARLEELRLEAQEERIEADLALGRHPDLLGELQVLVADNPLRERPRGQLMLALYRCGRQTEALELYRETRRAPTLPSSSGSNPKPGVASWSAPRTPSPPCSSGTVRSPSAPPTSASWASSGSRRSTKTTRSARSRLRPSCKTSTGSASASRPERWSPTARRSAETS